MIRKIHAFIRSQLSLDNASSDGINSGIIQNLLKDSKRKLKEQPMRYQSSLLQKLEPRFMFDGAAFATVDLSDGVSSEEQTAVLDAVSSNDHVDAAKSLFDALSLNAPGDAMDYSQYREVVIVDGRVKDPQVLIANINRDAAIEVILPSEDGVEAIAKMLEKYQDLSAIHIISHGDQAELYLGKVTLNSDNLNAYQTQLALWGQALNQNGDILFYGCNVAEGEKGQAFVDQLKALTDADIAASSDLTASTTHNGDGELEYGIDIDVASITSFEQYDHVLINEAPELSAGVAWQQLGLDIDGDAAGDLSGSSVSMSADGTRIAIGSPNSNATNGEQSGQVRVYSWNGSLWTQLGQDLEGEAAFDQSGYSVSMSDDGSRIAIGAINNDGNGIGRGHVRVYEWNNSAWVQVGLDIDGEADFDQSSYSVSMNADGSYVAIGAPFNAGVNGMNRGHVRVYHLAGSSWAQVGADINGTADDDQSGLSVAISDNGLRVAIGSPSATDGLGNATGVVKVYDWNGSIWTQVGTPITGEAEGDQSGRSIAMNADGSRIAIGAPTNQDAGWSSGHARVYEYNGSAWVQIGQDINGEAQDDMSGSSVSMSANGTTIAIGTPYNDGNGSNSGYVRIYKYDGALWVQVGGDLIGEAASDFSGWSVSMNSDGSRTAIGAFNNSGSGMGSGHVRVYDLVEVPSSVTYTENASALIINDKITVTDVDNITLQRATVTISSNYVDGQDVLTFTNIGNIIGSFNTATGVLTLTSSTSGWETLANYQAALRSVKYQNTSDNPSTLTRTISWVVNDGIANSVALTSVVNITAVNDAPVLTFESWAQLGQDIDGEAAGDNSGNAVAMSADGTRVVIGASNNAGINGANSGQVRVYGWNGTLWEKLGQDIDGEASGDNSGYSVAMSADGTIIAIGARSNDGNGNDSGHVRIYTYNGTSWVQLGLDINGEAANDQSGVSVALSADGTRVAIGANHNGGANGSDSGHVRIYSWNGTSWVKLGQDIDGKASADNSGTSVSISADGSRVAIGAANNDDNGSSSGQIRIYQWDALNNIWLKIGQDINGDVAGDQLGIAVAISADGLRLAVGSTANDGNGSNSGRVKIYQWNAVHSTWEQLGSNIDGDAANSQTGRSLSWSSDGKRIAIGLAGKWGVNGMFSGVVRVYQWNESSSNWVQFGDDINGEASSDTLGSSVAISADGTRVVAGAPGNDGNGPNSGHARVYYLAPIPTSFIENGVAKVINNKIVVTDVDSSNIQSASVSISANYINGQDILSFTNTANISGSFNSATGVLTLTGNDTLANYQTALRNVKYQNTSDNPSTLARTISWAVNDGSANSTVVTTVVNVTAVNDAPVVTAGGGLSYTENDPPKVINNTITVSDLDNTTLQSATVTIFMNYVNGQDILSFTNTANITGSFNATTGALSLTGTDTLANYQAALRTVKYQNTSESPSTSTRWISWIVNDGTANSSGATSTISIIPVNDVPVITAGASLSYVENDVPTVIDNTITVNDVDNTTLQSATVTISANYVNGQDILSFVNTANITGSFNATTGVLTLTGSDTLANYQAALRSVKYQNTSDNPSTLARTISWVVNDGVANSAATTSTINITAVNDVSVITAGNTLSYTENDAPSAIDNTITINDVDNTTLQSATISISGNYVASEDLLGFGGLGNVKLLSYDITTGLLTLTGTDTLANYQAALRLVTYQNLSNNPNTVARTISWKVYDGNAWSSEVTSTIAITAVNDAPKAVFETWVQMGQDLDGEAEWDLAGSSVALSADGQRMVMRALGNNGDTGHIRMYEYNGSTWIQMGNAITGATWGDWAGTSVSMNADGSVVAIGAPGNDTNGNQSGRVQIYSWNGSQWLQMGDDIVGERADDNSGESISLSADGQRIAIGAFSNDDTGLDSGHVRIYAYSNNTWVQLGSDIDGELAGDNSGRSVSMSADGSRVAIGAPGNDGTADGAGHVRIYQYQGNDWVQLGQDIDGEVAGDESGWSVSLSDDGSVVAIGAYQNDGNGLSSGHVRLYRYNGSSWVQLGQDIDGEAENDRSGYSVSLNSDGTRVAIGAPQNSPDYDTLFLAGHVRVYDWNGSAWVQIVSEINGALDDDRSGWSVSLSDDGSRVAIGAIYNEDNGYRSGHVRVFESGSLNMTYTENDGARVIDATITLTDIDDTHIETARIKISSNYVSGEDVLAFVNTSTIMGTFNASTGVLTLSGSDTLANYKAALRSVTYRNTSENPSTLTRTISWTVNDGGANSSLLTSTIKVVAVNDAPEISFATSEASSILSSLDGNIQPLLDLLIDPHDIDVEDPSGTYIDDGGDDMYDGGNILNTNLAEDIPYTNGQVLDGSNYFGAGSEYFTKEYAPGYFIMAATGIHITSFSITGDLGADGAGGTVGGEFVTSNGVYKVFYTLTSDDEGDDGDSSINHIVIVKNNAGLSHTFDSNTEYENHVISLSASDELYYILASQDDALTLTEEQVRNIANTFVDNYIVEVQTSDPQYVENAPAMVIKPNIFIKDADNTTLTGAIIRINNYVSGEDELSFTPVGNITHGGFANGVLTLTGTDTVANYRAALRSITYQNTSENPNTSARTISWTVNDGELDSVAASSTINVISVNDAPTAANKTVTINEDSEYTFAAGDFHFADIDGDTLASVKITTPAAAAGSLKLNGVDVTLNQVISKADIDSGLLKFTPVANANGMAYDGFGFKVNDGALDSASAYTITINVTAVNDAPMAANKTVTTNEDTDYTFASSDFNFTDIDGDTLSSVKITSLETVGSLKLNGVDVTLNQVISKANIDSGLLKFTPVANANGTSYDSFGFKVNDGTVDSSSAYTMTIDVTAVNDAPTAASKTVTTNEDTDYTFVTSDFNFADIDGDTLASVKITTLQTVGSLKLDGVDVTLNQVISKANIDSGLLKFTPVANANGMAYDGLGFKVNDGALDSASAYTITINVTAVNDDPQGEMSIVGTREVGQTLSIINTITDVDGLGSFSYQWLRDNASITGATNTSYALTGDDVGKVIEVKITYVDGYGKAESIISSSGNGSDLRVRSAPPIVEQSRNDMNLSTELVDISPMKLSMDTEIMSVSLSSSIESISVTSELHYSLDLFSQALEDKVPDQTLSEVAANVFRSAMQDSTQTQVVGNMLQKAINANESPTRIGYIASGIFSASLDTQVSRDVIAQTIVQEIVESNLGDLEISEALSTMILNAPVESAPNVMQAVLTEPRINEAHITKIHSYLNEQDAELARQFADKTTSTKASVSTDSTKDTSQNLLSRLKARFFGDRYDMGQQETAYSEQEHAFNIKLAKAKLMRLVA